MSEMSFTDIATTTRLPEAAVDNRRKVRLDWKVLVVGAALVSTVVWTGFVFWLFVWAAGSVLA